MKSVKRCCRWDTTNVQADLYIPSKGIIKMQYPFLVGSNAYFPHGSKRSGKEGGGKSGWVVRYCPHKGDIQGETVLTKFPYWLTENQ